MSGIVEAVKEVLVPYVGPMAADTCVRATAISMGKTTLDLTFADLPALETSIRKLLAPVAPHAVIEDAIRQLQRVESGGLR